MTADARNLKMDRMRYTKDKFSARFVLLAIVFNALYFIKLYQLDVGTYYYKWQIGASVIYNLIFMLAAFLASEGVKSRKTGFTGVLLAVGALQIARIFYLPFQAVGATVSIDNTEIAVMTRGQFIYIVVCLSVSAVCCAVAAVTSYINNKTLAQYMRYLENQSA